MEIRVWTCLVSLVNAFSPICSIKCVYRFMYIPDVVGKREAEKKMRGGAQGVVLDVCIYTYSKLWIWLL